MSDELEFASPDAVNFAWPATERRRPKVAPRPRRTAADRENRRVLHTARSLARRWQDGDDDVTMQDIIDVLLRGDPIVEMARTDDGG